MSQTVIKVENLGKQYHLGQVGTGTMMHDINRWLYMVRGKEDPYLQIGEANDRSTKGTSEYVWSLKDINFEVKQGDVLGIIGKNGAGKSTLLKILSRVTNPTVGNVKIKGRVASLLEVGTGFHPELTGRENIFLNGAILGMTKQEIRSKFDEMVDFSGVERYIDTPVKRYSSGMYVRLAFAVAAHLEPEILIVDEVLAVGDAEFQKKCLGKMKDVSGQGRTVLFVSHNMGAIGALCTKGIVLDKGNLIYEGTANSAINAYLMHGVNAIKTPEVLFRNNENEFGYFTAARISSKSKTETNMIYNIIDELTLEIDYVFKRPIPSSCVCITVLKDGETQFHSYDTDLDQQILEHRPAGEYTAKLKLPSPLREGIYFINFSLGTLSSTFDYQVEKLGFEVVFKNDNPNNYSYSRPANYAASIFWDTQKTK